MRPLSNSPAIARIASIPTLRGPVSGPARGPAAAAAGPGPDVEMSIRLHRDGTQIEVMRRTVAEGDARRTIGIEAFIR